MDAFYKACLKRYLKFLKKLENIYLYFIISQYLFQVFVNENYVVK